MSEADFFDSNVLLYLLSAEHGKAERVEELLADGGVISIQVLDEFASVASRKFHKGIAEIREVLAGIRAVCIVNAADIDTHDMGLEIAGRYKFSVYDSMLVAAALQAGCVTFFTEDLQHGQKIGGMAIRNPFRR